VSDLILLESVKTLFCVYAMSLGELYQTFRKKLLPSSSAVNQSKKKCLWTALPLNVNPLISSETPKQLEERHSVIVHKTRIPGKVPSVESVAMVESFQNVPLNFLQAFQSFSED